MAVVIGVYRSSNRLEKAAGLVFLARLECHGSVRATLQGVTIKSGSPDAGKYLFADGTLVVDNENTLINYTSGTGGLQTMLILGAATNQFVNAGHPAPSNVFYRMVHP